MVEGSGGRQLLDRALEAWVFFFKGPFLSIVINTLCPFQDECSFRDTPIFCPSWMQWFVWHVCLGLLYLNCKLSLLRAPGR